jgi:hypothetical protein
MCDGKGGYVRLHQWKLRSEDSRFVVWNPQSRIYVDEALGDEAEVTVETVYEEEATSRTRS